MNTIDQDRRCDCFNNRHAAHHINERLPKENQNVGSIGGAGSTVTAGGLLFLPTNDTYFHALDSKTGNEVWSVKLDANMNANPMAYTGKSLKQYVAGVAGGAVVAFALQ